MAVPAAVRNKALAAGAESWLRDLPDLVAVLEQEWAIIVGRAFGDATEAFVAAVTLADGTPAVLKLLVPRDFDAAGHEITALRLAAGDGCVRLLRADESRGAMLLERLGPSMYELGLPMGQRHEILCSCAEKMWRPAPESGLPTGADKGRRLAGSSRGPGRNWTARVRQRAVAEALACAERRVAAHDDERAVLVHGDVHQWNALRAGDGFKLVDPDGAPRRTRVRPGHPDARGPGGTADRRPAPPVPLARPPVRSGRDRHLGVGRGRAGVDRPAVTRIGLQPVGREMLAAADYVCGA